MTPWIVAMGIMTVLCVSSTAMTYWLLGLCREQIAIMRQLIDAVPDEGKEK